MRSNPFRWEGVCPSGAHIKHGVAKQPVIMRSVMDGIDLDENTGLCRLWTGWVLMPLLPARISAGPVSA
jgi:hypothetical protein